jgi:hypothetical protein
MHRHTAPHNGCFARLGHIARKIATAWILNIEENRLALTAQVDIKLPGSGVLGIR